MGWLESAEVDGGLAVVITGPPGIGKSALGLRLARHCAETFPDGQVYVDLTPILPGAERVDPVPALLRVLLPVDAALPQERQQQVELLRSILATRRMLILIDDIASEMALHELLSIEGPFSLVCTSRAKLSGLSGLVHFIELDPLPEHHGRELVETVVRQGKLTDEQTSGLVKACAGHPLALHVAAAHLARRPRMNVKAYLQDIVSPDHAMRALVAGQTALEPVIERSFADLDPNQKRLLERLGMMPHMSVTPDIAAAVATAEGTSVDDVLIREATQLLDSLFESGLIEQVDEDRYIFHEILHRFARSKSTPTKQGLRETAIRRACQVLAIRAQTAIRAIGFTDDQARTPADSTKRALRILETDRPGTIAMMELAHKHRLWDPLVLLVSEITPWLAHASHWKDIVRVSEWLLDAGAESKTPEWCIAALYNLGTAYSRTGETGGAIDFYRRSAISAHDSEDPYLGHMAQLAFAELLIDLGQSQEAIRLLRDGLPFWRHIEDETTLARALGNLGFANLLLGRLRRAEQYLNNSESLTKDTGRDSPRVRSARGALLRGTGRTSEAAQRACEDVERARAVGNRDWEAQALIELSLTAPRDRPSSAPEEPLTLALEIYRDTHDVRNQVHTLYLLGAQTAKEKEIPKAIEYLVECAELAARIGDSERVAGSLAYLATFSGAMGRLEEAEDYFAQAQTAALDTGSPLVISLVHRRRASHYRALGRANEAVPIFTQAVSIMERTDDARNLAELRADLGETLIAARRWQDGSKVLHQVLSDNSSEEARAQAYRALGILYCHRGLHTEAGSLIRRALEYHEGIADRSGVMHCRMALGNLHNQQGNWSNALEQYQVAAEIAQERKEFPVFISAQSMQASCYFKNGEDEKGLRSSQKLIPLAENLGMLAIKAALHANMGSHLSRGGDHQTALTEFREALTVADDLQDHALRARCLLNSARAHLALRNREHARDAAREALIIHQRLESWAEAAKSLRFLLQLHHEITPEEEQIPVSELLGAEQQIDQRIVEALGALVRQPLKGGHTDLSTTQTGRRKINVSDRVHRELHGIDIATLFLHHEESRSECFSCGLMIANKGEANLILLRTSETHTLRTRLAHLLCMPSSVIEVETEHIGRPDFNFEFECILFGGDTAGIVIDCHGGMRFDKKAKQKDILLSALQALGFVDLKSWISENKNHLIDLRKIVKTEITRAHLDGNKLSIAGPNGSFIRDAPLKFFPNWYAKAREGYLIVIFGRNLQEMMADDPSFFLRATELGRAVGANIRLAITLPRRNAPCVCDPATGLKFKKCCGNSSHR